VGEEESGLDVTPIGVFPILENLIIELDIVVVDGVIESDCNHLGNVLCLEITRDGRPIL